MIIKTLDFADVYAPLSPLLAPAFEFLRAPDLAQRADGRYDLRGDDLFALVQSYTTQPASEKQVWEAHRAYVDVQYVLAGVEQMGYAPRAALRETQPYDAEKEAAFYADPTGAAGSLVRLAQGMFCILGPEDAHLPGVALGPPAPVRKVVLKVAAASFRS